MHTLLIILPGGVELLLIILALVLLFGGRKIPQLLRGVGQGISEFRKASGEQQKESTD